MYTKVPRATLWLLQDGEARLGGGPMPVRRVAMPALYVGKSVITNAQFEAFDASFARPASAPGDDHPALGVSLDAARGYCAWYAKLSGKPFRLPTGDEWEWACRGGSEARYPWGEDPAAGDAFAWTASNAGGAAHDVETRRANGFGLHDTIGLAWEWTAEGVLRGGSYRSRLEDIGCATRAESSPDSGFRIVRAL